MTPTLFKESQHATEVNKDGEGSHTSWKAMVDRGPGSAPRVPHTGETAADPQATLLGTGTLHDAHAGAAT